MTQHRVDGAEDNPVFVKTTGEGDTNAARIENLGGKGFVEIYLNSNGPCQMTVEVADVLGDWRPRATESLNDNDDTFRYETGYRHIRAYADQNLDVIELSAKARGPD